MWPQPSMDEVRQAQELADAGDPDYAWQVDPALVGDSAPWGAEILDRFIREGLGWEEFRTGNMYASAEESLRRARVLPLRAGTDEPSVPRRPRGRGVRADDR